MDEIEGSFNTWKETLARATDKIVVLERENKRLNQEAFGLDVSLDTAKKEINELLEKIVWMAVEQDDPSIAIDWIVEKVQEYNLQIKPEET